MVRPVGAGASLRVRWAFAQRRWGTGQGVRRSWFIDGEDVGGEDRLVVLVLVPGATRRVVEWRRIEAR